MELSFFRVASRTICLQDKVIKSHRQHDVISLQKVLRLGVFSSAVCVLNDSTYLYYLRNETFIFEYQNVLGYTITASEFCKMFQASVLRDNVKKKPGVEVVVKITSGQSLSCRQSLLQLLYSRWKHLVALSYYDMSNQSVGILASTVYLQVVIKAC